MLVISGEIILLSIVPRREAMRGEERGRMAGSCPPGDRQVLAQRTRQASHLLFCVCAEDTEASADT